MAQLRQIVVDGAHPPALAKFWEAALDGFSIRAYDDEEVARLAAIGRTPDTDPVVILDGPNGLELCFQETDVAAMPKRPMHLDLTAADREAEVRRLVALGAIVHEEHPDHTWLRDPENNDFCVTGPLRLAPDPCTRIN